MRRIFISLCVILLALALRAQDQAYTNSATSIVNLNDSASVYRALYENTPIEPAFMLVPKFAIVGADGKFVFSVGASMKFTACYDWGNPVTNPRGMGTSDIQEAKLGDNSLYQMTAGGSGIFFNIIGFPNTAKQIGLFISIGIDKESNNSYKLGAGQVYMRYRNFQCGYATSLYNDRRADAYTIDSHGGCSSGAHSAVGMNWQKFVSNRLRFGVGIELPRSSYTQVLSLQSGVDSKLLDDLASNQTVPDFPAYVEYDWKTGHIRLSTIFRTINYLNYSTMLTHHHYGQTFKLTGHASFGPLGLFWMGQYGSATASYFLDNSGCGLDMVPDQTKWGRLKSTHSWGGIIGAQWDITPKIFSTAQYSYLRNYIPRYSVPAVTKYDDLQRRGYTVTANVIWKISSLFNTGIEYRYARRTDEAHNSLGNNRVYAMMLMTF